MQSKIVLFEDKKDCCGCGACINICPKNAIEMQEDEYGFLYPKINLEFCIECRLCTRACAFQNKEAENSPVKTFAAAARDMRTAEKSASGGVFASLAGQVISEGGAAFGAAFEKGWNVCHIKAEASEDIARLQGSKYTQSSTGDTYREVKQLLSSGRKVLYSGTPCQIAGLYGFLGRDYDNLVTIDLICHGVPNNRMFREYIELLEEQESAAVKEFTFRDKSIGWGTNGSAVFEKNGSLSKKKLWQSASSYLFYFSKSWIYRDSCYSCKYACSHRPADITIGDYWGIEKAHPDYIGKCGWDERKGISVAVANTEKGVQLLEMSGGCLELRASDFSKAADGNAQLRCPSKPGKREEILAVYKQGGWKALDKRFNESAGWRKYTSQIKALIPQSLKRKLKG